MPLLLDKVLTLLALPVGVGVGLGTLALAALALGRRRSAAGLLTFTVVWLWVWSLPPVSSALDASLTDDYPFRQVEELPTADAIVVLGNVRPSRLHRAYPDLKDSSDRAWHTARLYRAGKAPVIVVSAGNVWPTRGGQQTTAEATRVLLVALGVPEEAILLEDRSRNTRQNALFTAEIAADRGLGRVLLATSAWHMRRAEAAFRRVGLDVVPAATDYVQSGHPPPWVFRILPNADALSHSTQLLREHLGLLVYRLRGWA